jgi:hypothetical protein
MYNLWRIIMCKKVLSIILVMGMLLCSFGSVWAETYSILRTFEVKGNSAELITNATGCLYLRMNMRKEVDAGEKLREIIQTIKDNPALLTGLDISIHTMGGEPYTSKEKAYLFFGALKE